MLSKRTLVNFSKFAFTFTLMILLWPSKATAQDPFMGSEQVLMNSITDPNTVDIGDLDGDGVPDVITAESYTGNRDNRMYWTTISGGTVDQTSIGVGNPAYKGIRISDVDGDGDNDIVSVNSGQSGWWENTGGASFLYIKSLEDPVSDPSLLEMADLNDDGAPEMIVGSENSERLAYYENDGSGTFGAPINLSEGVKKPRHVVAKDFDQDGDVDIIATFETGIGWFSNDGSGSFSNLNDISNDSNSPFDLGVADVDGDGDMDVISSGTQSGGIFWYENNGDETFGDVQEIDTEAFGARGVEVIDFNDDGAPDIAAAVSESDEVKMYMNDGSGTFGTTFSVSTSQNGAFALETGDIDGDGDPDLVASGGAEGEVSYYQNYANESPNPEATDETFYTASGEQLSIDAPGLLANDTDPFDRTLTAEIVDDPAHGTASVSTDGSFTYTSDAGFDGKDSLTYRAIAEGSAADTAKVELYVSATGWVTTFEQANQRIEAGDGVFADFNNDGYQDLIIVGSGGTYFYKGNPEGVGNAQGRFIKQRTDLINPSSPAIAVADIDGNETLDLIISGQTGSKLRTEVYLNDGEANFSPMETDLPGYENPSIALKDFDGDGDPDLFLTGDLDNSINYDLESNVYLNDGNGNFSETSDLYDAISLGDVAAKDINGDGHIDLLMTGTGRTTLYEGDGTGSFTEVNTDLPQLEHSAVALADAGGDGDLDLIINGEGEEDEYQAFYFENEGDFSFDQQFIGLEGVKRGDVLFEDINGDGNPDIISSGEQYSGSVTQVFLGDSDGGFTSAEHSFREMENADFVTTDLGGDGDTDILFSGSVPFDGLYTDLYINVFKGSGSNDSPVAQDDSLETVNVGEASVQAPGVLFNDEDPEGAVLSASVVTSPSNGTLTLNEDGSYTYRPNDGYEGTDEFTYQASDGTSSDEATVHLEITGVDSAPELNGYSAGFAGVRDGAVEIADLNGDGNLDVVLQGESEIGFDDWSVFEVHFGDGEGNFTRSDQELPSNFTGEVHLEDFDNDGAIDIYASSRGLMFWNDGDGNFSDPDTVSASLTSSGSDVADVDNDGNIDLMTTGESGFTPTTTLYLNNGDRTFTESEESFINVESGDVFFRNPEESNSPSVLVSGENADGDPESEIYTNSLGSFNSLNQNIENVYRTAAAWGDLNNDGRIDLIIAGYDSDFNAVTKTYLSDEFGDLVEVEGTLLPNVYSGSVDIVDIGGDGLNDVVITGDETAGIYINQGDSTFAEAGSPANIDPVSYSDVAIADLDNDGDLDYIVTGKDPELDRTNTKVYLNGDEITTNEPPVANADTLYVEQNETLEVEAPGITANDEDPDNFYLQTTVQTNVQHGTLTLGTYGSVEYTPDTDFTGVDSLIYSASDGTNSDTSVVYFDVESGTPVESGIDLPKQVELEQNYPNPFNPKTAIKFGVPERSDVTMEVYNVLGRKVATLVDEVKSAGYYTVNFDASQLSSGVYIYRLNAGDKELVRKMTLIK